MLKARKSRESYHLFRAQVVPMDMILNQLWETVRDKKSGVLQFMGLWRVGHDLATEQQQQQVVPSTILSFS